VRDTATQHNQHFPETVRERVRERMKERYLRVEMERPERGSDGAATGEREGAATGEREGAATGEGEGGWVFF
jgi:hypothetical protein